jgi:uncharacterized protein
MNYPAAKLRGIKRGILLIKIINIFMNPFDIINKYYKTGAQGYDVLVRHSELVMEKAVLIAKSEKIAKLNPDIDFIKEAAMLHDIGIFMTDAPKIGCNGTYPYICHGYLGRELLEKEGFLKHGLVAEHHTGSGISCEEIIKANLPLPHRDMLPTTLEEKIICYADKFFSKGRREMFKQETIEEVRAEMKAIGAIQLERFNNFVKIFE